MVDIENQVGDEMQRIVGKAVSASQKGRAKQTGDVKDPTVLEQELNMYKQAVSAVELNGLEKLASYWIQKEVKPSKNSKESKVYYEYYAVWGMNKKLYDLQIQSALARNFCNIFLKIFRKGIVSAILAPYTPIPNSRSSLLPYKESRVKFYSPFHSFLTKNMRVTI